MQAVQRDVRDAFRLEPSIATRLAEPALQLERAIAGEQQQIRILTRGPRTAANGHRLLEEQTRVDRALRAFRERVTATFLQLLETRTRDLRGHAFRMLGGLLGLVLSAVAVTVASLRRLESTLGPAPLLMSVRVLEGAMTPNTSGQAAVGSNRDRLIPITSGSSIRAPDPDQEAV